MTPADFRLYDALHCSAIAINEAGQGRASSAMTAWLAARGAASAMFAPGSTQCRALGVILSASAPSHAGEPRRYELWRALDAASIAALHAASGDTEAAGGMLLEASGRASDAPCQGALRVILTAIWDGVTEGVPA